jgi:hypothetical protein
MVGRYQGLSRRWVYETWICVDACFKAPVSREAHLLLQLVSKKGEVGASRFVLMTRELL